MSYLHVLKDLFVVQDTRSCVKSKKINNSPFATLPNCKSLVPKEAPANSTLMIHNGFYIKNICPNAARQTGLKA